MAQFPCDHCGHRYIGPGNRAYIAIYDGALKWEHKPHLCPAHLYELVELFEQVNGEIDPANGLQQPTETCLRCRGDATNHEPLPVFMTAYKGRLGRMDFFAPVCAVCRPDAEKLLNGSLRA